MRKLILSGLLAISCVFASRAYADSWRMPEVGAYSSTDGAWRLTVTPRPLKSQLQYFEDQVDGKERPGSPEGGAQDRAFGSMEQLRDGTWRAVWQGPLANDVAPVDVIVVPGGAAVTFDNWHSMGHGPHAIVVYDAGGGLVRALSLEDVLGRDYADALPRSVSSIQWRGSPFLAADSATVVVPVVVPNLDQGRGEDDTIEVHVDVADGDVSIPDATAWQAAQARARDVARQQEEQRAAAIARFLAPLEAPRTDALPEWHRYLFEAFGRLDPGAEEDYPATKVVPTRGAGGFERMAKYLGDAMIDEAGGDGLIMVGSPDQSGLVEVLREQVARVEPRSLVGSRIYVAIDAKHFPAAAEALAPTGATIIQLDIDTPIPQRPERIERMRERSE